MSKLFEGEIFVLIYQLLCNIKNSEMWKTNYQATEIYNCFDVLQNNLKNPRNRSCDSHFTAGCNNNSTCLSLVSPELFKKYILGIATAIVKKHSILSVKNLAVCSTALWHICQWNSSPK
uniref:Uncharacterized protein n=1 Tax=Sphaerodactylus townsendi TaxID=933632 RepID=A0ACB8EC47_9SAUR